MSIKWIEYQGKNILYCDYSGMYDTKKSISQLEEEASIIKQSNEKILVLDDMRDFFISKDFLERGKILGKEVNEKIDKMAQVFTMLGIKRMIVNLFIKFSGINLKIFNESEMQKAKDYLIS